MHSLTRFCLLSLTVGMSSLAACGDDDSTTTEDGGIPEPYHFSELKQPFTTSAQCISTFAKKHQDTSPSTTCRCNSCLDAMQECEAVNGCVEIVQCSDTSRCTNEFDCYLLPGAQCTAVIDKWGNSSLATAISLDILACTQANNCR